MNISLSILFDLFYFGEMFIHEVFTQNDKELVIAGKKICYIKQHINFSDSSIKDDPRFLILKHETLQRKWIDPPKQLIDISCATTSALMIESDAMIAIDYQDNNYQLSIYPSKAPVYYNQQLVTKGVFTFQVGDQIVVDQWIIERREKQWQIIGLGQAIQLNPWVLSEVPYIPEYPKHFPFFRRSPRIYLEEPKVQVEVRLPRHEAAQEKQSFFKLVLPSLGIFILSGMFLFFSNRNLLLILGMYGLNLLTSSISTINYLLNKKKIKRKKSEQKITIQQYRIKKAFELNRLQQRQKEVLQYMYPSNDQLARMTKECHPRIYERRPKDKDFLTVRLGIGERPSSFKIVSSYLDEDQWNDEVLSDFIRPYQKLKNAPIAISLATQSVGLVGPSNVLQEALQSLLFQISVLHSYQEVEFITLLQEKEYEKTWKNWRWLPHHTLRSFPLKQRGLLFNLKNRELVLSAFYKILSKRKQQLQHADYQKIAFKPTYVFSIITEEGLWEHEISEFLTEELNRYGVVVIWAKESIDQLPETVTTLIAYQSQDIAMLINHKEQHINQPFTPNRLPTSYPLEQAIFRLANLFHEEIENQNLPEKINLLEQYQVQTVEELMISKRWLNAEPSKTLRSLIGWQRKNQGIYWDLHEQAHGPHALIGGTTGSGKSEFLITYLVGLAINFSPEDVGILVIDWKGGGLAQTVSKLPHFMGAITNLDRVGTSRALISIKAELEKRQRLLATYEVNNINEYMQLYKQRKQRNVSAYPDQPLPHLFLVSDEFAELKVNVPEFLEELTSVARIGRSLGVHLILATQKPAGVVNDQIEANSKSKVALKMASVQDSKELLQTTDAAYVSRPGRGYLKVGENDVYELFQSGYTKAPYAPNQSLEDERIVVVNEFGQKEVLFAPTEKDSRKAAGSIVTQYEAVRRLIVQTFQQSTFSQPSQPWLPELPTWLVMPVFKGNERNTLKVPIGLLDVPHEQKQSHYYYDCEKSSHTVVFASSGYGKSTLLQTIVLSLARQNTPNQVWFHLVDFGTNGLLPLKKLPHVVDIVTLEEEEKRQKMFVRINRSLAERKQLFKEKGATNLYQYQEKTSIQLPIIFIILDSYESLGIEDKRKDSIDETIVHLLRDGASLGIYLILSANRVGSIRLNMMSQFATKLFMYLHDESEIKQVLGREAIVALPIKGRGQVMLDRPTILQFYLPTNGQNESEIFEKMAEEITNIDQDWVGKRPEKILMVPERLTPKIFSQFVRNKEKDLVYLGLNKQTVEVESFAFFLGKQLGLFFTSNVQLQRMFSWWLSQMMDVEENVILIDVSGTLEQIKNEVTSYFSLHDVAKRSEKFTHFWDELWFTPKTRKIVVLNGLADFVEEMGLLSGEVSKLLNRGNSCFQFIFIDLLAKTGNFYGGMTQIVKENVSQILFDGSLQTQGFVDDFTFTRENNPNNKNSFYSLKDGKLEIIVVPVEEE